jgi:hypothetical protein
MNYKEYEVLDIIKSFTDLDPQQILDNWNDKKANTTLDLTERSYPSFVYTFPIIIKEEEVGSITIGQIGSANLERDYFMQKYFGAKDYEKCFWTFSHHSYLDCYFLIKKEFSLPKIVKGFHGQKFYGEDIKGKKFEFIISYGCPKKEEDEYIFEKYTSDNAEYTTYSFDSGVNIKIQNIKNGWSLGEKINDNIKKRIEKK